MIVQLETSVHGQHNSSTTPGMVQVFTDRTQGQKNIFTHVIAQALRLAQQGTSVIVVQFLKGGINQGQEHPTKLGENFEWLRSNLPRNLTIDRQEITPEETEAVQSLWQYTQEAILGGRYDLAVLDELTTAVHLGIIPEAKVLELVAQKPTPVDVIFTGNQVSPAILSHADQVTEIRRSW